jgi:hypothetical protein
LFLPHTLLWGLRELFLKTHKEESTGESESQTTD